MALATACAVFGLVLIHNDLFLFAGSEDLSFHGILEIGSADFEALFLL